MSGKFAEDFFEIPNTLATNDNLRESVINLIQKDPMPGKVLEGNNRLETFRRILIDLANGEISLDEAYLRTEEEIPRHESPHAHNNKVFPEGWAERQTRTQFSRFYNQAVLQKLRDGGATMCFVPHSTSEEAGSRCTQLLAGQEQQVNMLYQRLIDAYAQGNWSKEVKIPNHPHCTHVVTPVEG